METLLARAQIGLAAFYALAFVGIVIAMLFAPPSANESVLDLLKMLLGAIIALITQQSTYFFARQRPQTDTDVKLGAPEPTDRSNPR